jgi:hypothetical protein
MSSLPVNYDYLENSGRILLGKCEDFLFGKDRVYCRRWKGSIFCELEDRVCFWKGKGFEPIKEKAE